MRSSDFGRTFISAETSVNVRNADLDLKNMEEKDIVICSYLVYEFILNDK